MDNISQSELSLIEQANLPLGVLVNPGDHVGEQAKHRLLAQLMQFTPVAVTGNAQANTPATSFWLELVFPKQLDSNQGERIRELLQSLD
jgi:hypothetical protein